MANEPKDPSRLRTNRPVKQGERLGALRFVDAAKTLSAIRLVRQGQVISLNLPLDTAPAEARRPGLRRYAISHNSLRPTSDGRLLVINDDVVEFALQGTSQWDALAHFGVIEPGSRAVYYGGVGIEETLPEAKARTLGIDAMAGGVVTRGVLLDMVAFLGGPSREYLPDESRVRANDVRAYLRHHSIELESGDAVLVYTGFQRRVASNGGAYPATVPGVDADTIELWKAAEIFALISDNTAVEPVPAGNLDLHAGCIKGLGIYLGELWALDELADACRADGVYEFLLVSAPLNIPGAFGSPPNALAIR